MGLICRSDSSRIARRVSTMLLATLAFVLIFSLSVSCLPNIRIQVNNENLQSPPYLLDALKQVEKAEHREAEQAAARSQSNHQFVGASEDLQAAAPETKSKAEEISSNAKFVAGQSGESLEGALELGPESVLKLSPESIVGSSLSELGPLSNSPVDHELTNLGHESRDKQASSRLFQLDVTSSHLKRPSPSNAAELIEEELAGESSQRAPSSLKQQESNQEPTNGSGAKSRISPSVASEEASLQTSSSEAPETVLKEKIAASPPDTWEPSQVMQGVTNASLVPATVKKQYGHQTRTRITLGGGYQREQQPPLANPSSSDYQDNKPEKPVVPLERPQREQQAPSSALDNSRVIEVPERIVLPVSVFTKEKPVKENITLVVHKNRKRDSRCPSNGVTSLEHPTACDKYYLCEDGYSSEQVCPNGLMYGTRDIVRDYCVHRWQAVCGDKSIPNPISSPGCRWQNGIFNVQGSPKCTPDFYECTDGLFEVKKCTISGQVYDDKTKSCQYAEQVGCAQEALADFQCPADDQSNTYWPFPRYFLNERALIHCVSDKPQIIRCRDHERVDPEHLFCVPIDKSAPPVNEDGSAGEVAVSARRATSTQREKGKKVQKSSHE